MTLTSAAVPDSAQGTPLRLLRAEQVGGRVRHLAVAADRGLDEVLLDALPETGWQAEDAAFRLAALEPRVGEGLFARDVPGDAGREGARRIDAIVLLVRGNVPGPLLTQARNWDDSVLYLASADERRALRAPAVAVTRISDIPITGTTSLHAWQRWLDLSPRLHQKVPSVFRVTIGPSADGDHDLHADEDRAALSWILRRLDHEVDAAVTPVGLVPFRHDFELNTTRIADSEIRGLLTLDASSWRVECDRIAEAFERSDRPVPMVLRTRLRRLAAELDDFR